MQCRITTEDPGNDFMPDHGRITRVPPAAGFGIRLDDGTAYTGAIVSPYYDSLLAKVCPWDRTLKDGPARCCGRCGSSASAA